MTWPNITLKRGHHPERHPARRGSTSRPASSSPPPATSSTRSTAAITLIGPGGEAPAGVGVRRGVPGQVEGPGVRRRLERHGDRGAGDRPPWIPRQEPSPDAAGRRAGVVARPAFGDALADRGAAAPAGSGVSPSGAAAGDVVRRSVEFANVLGLSAVGRWALARRRGRRRRRPAGAAADRLLAVVSGRPDDVARRRRDRRPRRSRRPRGSPPGATAASAVRRDAAAPRAASPAAAPRRPNGPLGAAVGRHLRPSARRRAAARVPRDRRRGRRGAPPSWTAWRSCSASAPPVPTETTSSSDAARRRARRRPAADPPVRRGARAGTARGEAMPRRGLPIAMARRGATVAGPATSPGAIASGLRAELDATPPIPAANVRRSAASTDDASNRAAAPSSGGRAPSTRPGAPGRAPGGFASRAPQPSRDAGGPAPAPAGRRPPSTPAAASTPSVRARLVEAGAGGRPAGGPACGSPFPEGPPRGVRPDEIDRDGRQDTRSGAGSRTPAGHAGAGVARRTPPGAAPDHDSGRPRWGRGRPPHTSPVRRRLRPARHGRDPRRPAGRAPGCSTARSGGGGSSRRPSSCRDPCGPPSPGRPGPRPRTRPTRHRPPRRRRAPTPVSRPGHHEPAPSGRQRRRPTAPPRGRQHRQHRERPARPAAPVPRARITRTGARHRARQQGPATSATDVADGSPPTPSGAGASAAGPSAAGSAGRALPLGVADLASRRRPTSPGHPAGAVARPDELGVLRRLPTTLTPPDDAIALGSDAAGRVGPPRWSRRHRRRHDVRAGDRRSVGRPEPCRRHPSGRPPRHPHRTRDPRPSGAGRHRRPLDHHEPRSRRHPPHGPRHGPDGAGTRRRPRPAGARLAVAVPRSARHVATGGAAAVERCTGRRCGRCRRPRPERRRTGDGGVARAPHRRRLADVAAPDRRHDGHRRTATRRVRRPDRSGDGDRDRGARRPVADVPRHRPPARRAAPGVTTDGTRGARPRRPAPPPRRRGAGGDRRPPRR